MLGVLRPVDKPLDAVDQVDDDHPSPGEDALDVRVVVLAGLLVEEVRPLFLESDEPAEAAGVDDVEGQFRVPGAYDIE